MEQTAVVTNYTERFSPEHVDNLCKLEPQELLVQMYGEAAKMEDKIEDHRHGLQTNGDYVRHILRWVQLVKEENYELKMTYERKGGHGRRYVAGFGIQSLKGNVRGYLQLIVTFDYDMRGAHFRCLKILISKHAIPDVITAYLEQYLRDRNGIYITNRQHFSDIKDFKKKAIVALNSDKCPYGSCQWIKDFHTSLKPIKEWLYDKFRTEYPPNPVSKHPKSSVLNQLMCVEEDNLLQMAEAALEANGIEVSVLMFDGLMIPAAHKTEDVLQVLTDATREHEVEWAMKPHEPLTYVEPPARVGGGGEYGAMKTEFELKNFMVLEPEVVYVTISQNRDGTEKLVRYNLRGFEQRYNNMKVKVMKPDGNTKEMPFIQKWVGDCERREYKVMDFLPPPMFCPADTYNLYSGMLWESYQEEGVEPDGSGVPVFLEHLRVIAGNESTDEVAKYLLYYFAHLIQKPGELPGVAPLLRGGFGVGKNILLQMVMWNVVGRQYYLETANTEAITGRFNNIAHKLVVCYNEANGKDTATAFELIKTYITDPTIEWEAKGVQGITLLNFMRLLFLTNNENCVPIQPKERRIQAIECSPTIPPRECFEAFARAFQLREGEPDKPKCLGIALYLKNLDLGKWKAKDCRVETDLYRAMASTKVDLVDRFLHHHLLTLDRDGNMDVQAREIFSDYQRWCQGKRFTPSTNTMFGRKLFSQANSDAGTPNYDGISKTKRKGVAVYVIDFKAVVGALHSKKAINDDEKAELLSDHRTTNGDSNFRG
jgi:hypothetical protein